VFKQTIVVPASGKGLELIKGDMVTHILSIVSKLDVAIFINRKVCWHGGDLDEHTNQPIKCASKHADSNDCLFNMKKRWPFKADLNEAL